MGIFSKLSVKNKFVLAILFLGLFFGYAKNASAATSIYRSVGPGASVSLNINNATVEISGTTAIFSQAMPDNIGVGDVLQYQVNGTYYAAFISGRTSSTVYTVASNSGLTPQAAVAGTAVSIFRAYISLANAEKGVENTAIDISIRNFDDWTAGGDATTDEVGKDLVAADQQWNIAAYAGQGNLADTTGVVIDGWTADATRTLNIYTPTESTEVGVSQRHSGKWNDTKYKMNLVGAQIEVYDRYVNLNGLQIKNSGNGWAGRTCIFTRSGTRMSIENSILVIDYVYAGVAHSAGINIEYDAAGMFPDGSGYLIARNNIIYSTRFHAQIGGVVDRSIGDTTVTLDNNTISNCNFGILRTVNHGGTINKNLYRNNLIQGAAYDTSTSVGGFTGVGFGQATGASAQISTSCDYNISNDNTAPNATFASGNQTVNFLNTAINDFHLSGDSTAKNQGLDLSAFFTKDIDGESRPIDSIWDIGADEAAPDVVAPERTNTLPTGQLVAGTTSTSISLTTNENSTCKYATSANVPYADMTNTFNTTGSTTHSTTVSGLSDGNSYSYYIRCSDTLGNKNTDDVAINFSIALPDLTAPVLSGGLPTGTLAVDTTSTTVSLTTNENATCKYSTTAGVSYGSMTNTFSTTGATAHSMTAAGLVNGGNYNYYVRCQDSSGNSNDTDYTISFSVASLFVDVNSCTRYLNQPGATYTLQSDVTSDGNCFAIIGNNITLDLNGHTITYDNAPSIVVPNGDFENGTGALADDWDLSSAPNAVREPGTYVQPVSLYSGSYGLKFSVPATDQQIRSTQQVTLEPNTTYSISGMVYNNYYSGGYKSGNISLYVGLDDGTQNKTAIKTGITWRGFQYINKSFTTGNAPESYNIIAGISGAGAEVAGSVYIDDIRIQKHRSVGVVVGPPAHQANSFPEVKTYGGANNTVIKNGKIVQAGLSDYAHAIMVGETSANNFDFYNLEISTKGSNAAAISSLNFTNSKIHNNLIHHEPRAITSRDAFDGAAIKIEYGGDGGKIYDNVIDKGVQSGIVASTKGTAVNPMEVYGNNITLQTKYTNDFAIVSGGSLVHDNIINCGTGVNSCRGIGVGSKTKLYNNTISVQQLKRNQEYNGCEASGAYGIQAEASVNAEVYGNTVTANSGICDAIAFRANPNAEAGGGANLSVHNNIFKAFATGNAAAASIKIADANVNSLDFRDNELVSNRNWVYFDGHAVGLVFNHNTFKTEGTVDNPFKPLSTYNWNGTIYPEGVKFINNVYPDLATAGIFKSSSFVNGGSTDTYSSFYYGWPLTVTVKNDSNEVIVGAAVTIKDSTNAEVYSGVTDGNGQIVADLNEFKNQAGTVTEYNPFTVTASASTFTAQEYVTMDMAKSLTLILNSSGQDVSAPSITSFIVPSNSDSLNVPITEFVASDNTAVTGYLISESSSTPTVDDSRWRALAQTEFNFVSQGAKTLYAWAKDAVGNISNYVSALITVMTVDSLAPSQPVDLKFE